MPSMKGIFPSTSIDASVGDEVPPELFAVGNGHGARETGNFSTWAVAQRRQLPLVGLWQVHVKNWLRLIHLEEDFAFQ